MKPKVTIGVCVKNAEATIKDAIESILAQDYPHELMEVIFVDESDDETPSIIKEYVSRIDMSVKVFHYKRRMGLGLSRNIVVENANGDYVVWVDGDMVLSDDFISKLVEFMEQHPEVGVAKGKQALEPGSNLLSTLEAYSRAAGRMVDYTSGKARFKVLGTAGSIYRAEALKQVIGFDKNLLGYGEDWDIELRIRKAGWTLYTVDTKYYDYERNKLTWRDLWRRYWLRGYYSHYFLHKNPGLIMHYRMFPPAAFITGLLHSRKLYGVTNQKSVFLLPIQYVFKMTAWYIGFIRSHLDSYEPVL